LRAGSGIARRRKSQVANYFGSDLTSASHFASKRLRSAEEPYFLKS
jgi:hypothetical protein